MNDTALPVGHERGQAGQPRIDWTCAALYHYHHHKNQNHFHRKNGRADDCGFSKKNDAMGFPEHEKLTKVLEQSQWIGEFLDWCQNERGLHFYEMKKPKGFSEEVPVLFSASINQLLAEYFSIDLVKIEKEKRAMLRQINAMME